MARKKSDTVQAADNTKKVVAEETEKKVNETKANADIPENVLNLMRLYPQYEKLYVSKNGFVYTENTSESVRGDAVLYTNKFYKQ